MLYILITSILFFFAILEVLSIKICFKKYLYVCVLLLFIALGGFRWKVGGDTHTYQFIFEEFVPSFKDLEIGNFILLGWEPLFSLLMIFSKSIISKFWFFQVLHVSFVNIVLFRFFYKESRLLFLCVFLYFFFSYLYFNTEILREVIAVCLFVLGYQLIGKGKIVMYYFIVLIACLFHYSALITLLIPFLVRIETNKKNLFFGLVIVVGLFPLAYYFSSFCSFLGLEILAKKIETYTQIQMNLRGISFISIVYLILPLVYYFFNEKISKKGLSENKIKFKELSFTYFFFILIYIFFNGFGRFLNYLLPFIFVYFASSFVIFFSYIKASRFSKLLIFLFFLFIPISLKISYYLQNTSNIVANSRLYNRWYPYSSIFNQDTYWKERETLYKDGMKESFESEVNK